MAPGASLRKALTLWRLPSRGTVLIAATLIAGLIGSWLLAHRAVGQLLDSMRWFGTPEYGAVSVGLGGTVEIRNVRLRALEPREADLFRADVMRIETPGLHWLVWTSLTGGPSSRGIADFLGSSRLERVQQAGGVPFAIPAADRLALHLEGFTAGPGLTRAGDLQWMGLTSGAPFDAEGCDGRTRFDAKTLAAMGLGEEATRVDAEFLVTSADNATLTFALERPGTSRLELEMSLRTDDVRHLPDTNWSNVVILERKWIVRDQGFISARNRWCAVKMGVSRDGFVERHLAAIKRVLSESGASPTAELESAYRRYASRGAELTFHSRPNLTTPIGQLERFTPNERLRILNATLESVRGRGAAFRFAFVEPTVAIAGADPDSAQPGAPIPASAVATTMTPGVLDPSVPPVADAATRPIANPIATPIVPAAVPMVATAPPVSRLPAPVVRAVPTQPTPTDATPPVAPLRLSESTPRSSAAPTTIATAPAPVPVLPPPTPGRKLAYQDLAQLEGRRIMVRSSYGSVRVGTLEKYTDTAITLRLEQRERGLSVTMPQNTVRDVQLIEYRPLLDTLHFLDNSSDTPRLIFKDESGQTTISDNALYTELRRQIAS